MDITDPVERAAYLDRACGQDESLRLHLEGLLAEQEQLGSFLAQPLASPAIAVGHAMLSEGVGTKIGPYKLLQKIGEGGMGVVYMAEQESPVRRKVALKIIKPGLDSAQVVARFEAERQALALMDHTNIARVFDAGTTDSGRPYFVMELVHGVPITRFCDDNQLTPRDRLELFIPVCLAIQHAHQKGIIHRDIKPSNLMVTMSDDKPTPKVIDFGVAKAIDQRLTEKTLFTQYGALVGTLEYMSPEQAEFNAADVDTRADIYSLGVVLYELLTGTTPLTQERLKQAVLTEVLRLIREEEPPRPSTRLSESKGSLASISAQRKLEPARLHKEVRGELDWIVMKALDKNRGRRYATANALARDVERHLRDEPVEACPPTAGYRLRKFAGKHRRLLGAVIMFALLLAGGAAVSTWQALKARAAQRQALAAQEGEAEQRKQTQAVLAFVQDHVFAAARPVGRPGGLGPEVTLRRAVEAALPVVEQSFATQPLVEARLRMTLGTSFLYLGDARTAADQFQRARAIYTTQFGADHPDTVESMHNLAAAYGDLGRNTEALALREETLARRRAALGPDHVDTLQSMRNLANSYAAVNRFDDALKLDLATVTLMKARLGTGNPATLAAMNNLAQDYTDLGRNEDALKLQEETLALQKATLGPDHPDTLNGMTNVGNAYADLGRHAEAVKLREETLALQKARLPADHPDMLKAMHNLANSYGALGRHTESLKLHRETMALREARLGPDHINTLHSMWGVAAELYALDRGAEAVPITDECLRRAATLPVQPDVLGLANLRVQYFAKRKDAAGCKASAELWEKMGRSDAASLYNAACYRAVTAAVIRATDKSPGAAREAEGQADRAIAWLKKALDAGYKNVASLSRDTDLDALRDRADFKKMVAEQQARNNTR